VLSRLPARVTWRLPAWAESARALPLVQAFERRLDPAFVRFGLVGVAGFTVDASVLHAMVDFVGLNYFTGRLASFSVAVAATWVLNRSFTFRHKGHHGPLRQAMLYAAVQGAGGAANIAAYSAAIAMAPALSHMLLVPLAIGSGVGLCLTFLGSKHLAFRAAAAGV
jgi:putative flippase GtrA